MTLIPHLGSFATMEATKAMGDRLQRWLDEKFTGLEAFYDGLSWYVKGGDKQQQREAVDHIIERICSSYQ